ncbi:MAG: class I SAM-dependent methyltransferase [Chitinophagaceae bacterium]|nr:class I SAM-dependent methyltransferase [Chitinophagaceae bacterium]
MGVFYNSTIYIPHDADGGGLVNRLYRSVRNVTVKQKAATIKKYTQLSAGNLLDIGCGTGTFMYAMAQRNWKVTGVEPDGDARDTAKALYGMEVFPPEHLFSLPPGSFNAITLWHVLEHIHRLHEYIEQMRKLLAENGIIFIAVPNYTSWDARKYGRYWAGYDVPRHLYHFSPQSMELLMQKHSLQVVKQLPMWFDSFYVDILSSKYKRGHIQYLPAGIHGLISNINALGRRKECCSLIYVIK